MRHSSKNAIPTKPQKQPAIAQNFHIKKRGGKKGERRGKREKKKRARKREKRENEREVPVVAAVVLVCLPADEPQGSHGTFEASRRARGGREERAGRGRTRRKGSKEEDIRRKRKGRVKREKRGTKRKSGKVGSVPGKEEARDLIKERDNK